jgi:hypothetical protein
VFGQGLKIRAKSNSSSAHHVEASTRRIPTLAAALRRVPETRAYLQIESLATIPPKEGMSPRHALIIPIHNSEVDNAVDLAYARAYASEAPSRGQRAACEAVQER